MFIAGIFSGIVVSNYPSRSAMCKTGLSMERVVTGGKGLIVGDTYDPR
jgi:hypothetical protein